MPTPKRYDEAYFDRWYRRCRAGIGAPDEVRRKAAVAVAVAEYALGRQLRSVLDVGCGEAPWRAHVRRLRPGADYLGVDPSEYVVRRFGRRRNVIRGSLGTLGDLGLRRRFDLVVCSDVLQYVGAAEVARGLAAIRRLLLGVAYLDVFTTADEVVGDRVDWHDRSPAHYRRLFRRAGLVPCGLHCYLTAPLADERAALEVFG